MEVKELIAWVQGGVVTPHHEIPMNHISGGGKRWRMRPLRGNQNYYLWFNMRVQCASSGWRTGTSTEDRTPLCVPSPQHLNAFKRAWTQKTWKKTKFIAVCALHHTEKKCTDKVPPLLSANRISGQKLILQISGGDFGEHIDEGSGLIVFRIAFCDLSWNSFWKGAYLTYLYQGYFYKATKTHCIFCQVATYGRLESLTPSLCSSGLFGNTAHKRYSKTLASASNTEKYWMVAEHGDLSTHSENMHFGIQ